MSNAKELFADGMDIVERYPLATLDLADYLDDVGNASAAQLLMDLYRAVHAQ